MKKRIDEKILKEIYNRYIKVPTLELLKEYEDGVEDVLLDNVGVFIKGIDEYIGLEDFISAEHYKDILYDAFYDFCDTNPSEIDLKYIDGFNIDFNKFKNLFNGKYDDEEVEEIIEYIEEQAGKSFNEIVKEIEKSQNELKGEDIEYEVDIEDKDLKKIEEELVNKYGEETFNEFINFVYENYEIVGKDGIFFYQNGEDALYHKIDIFDGTYYRYPLYKILLSTDYIEEIIDKYLEYKQSLNDNINMSI